MTNKFCKYSATGDELFKKQTKVYELKYSPFLSDNGLDYYKSSNILSITGEIGSGKTLLLTYIVADILVSNDTNKIIYLDTELTLDFTLLKQFVSEKILEENADVDNLLLSRLVYLPIRNPIEFSFILDGLEIYLKLNHNLIHCLVLDSSTFWSYKWLFKHNSGDENELKCLINDCLNRTRLLCTKYSLFFIYTRTTKNVEKHKHFTVHLNEPTQFLNDEPMELSYHKFSDTDDIKLSIDQYNSISSYGTSSSDISLLENPSKYYKNNDMDTPVNGKGNLYSPMDDLDGIYTPNTRRILCSSSELSGKMYSRCKSNRPVKLLCYIPESWIYKEQKIMDNELILMLLSIRDNDRHYIAFISKDNRSTDNINRCMDHERRKNGKPVENRLHSKYAVKRIKFEMETNEANLEISTNRDDKKTISGGFSRNQKQQTLDCNISNELLEKYNFAIYSFDNNP
ncbi:hypothetical protein BEWA_019840 [Theileria equi strain WA]|uniref:DNA recombination and repair protein Rad51-like C-terminal domain-containing protein n=1 Tax=Theileria equi strain WA TaxID=1537102 RepID=L0AV60_THEEQ|nr:hypothetical protein BEWA_019840 [Theileria equi strain WA]AFZ79138.1 hypothetical protein BEWA_019840 [Theileria equi strain WA]|eukprot:XP_004828804.1 hypothetical protein BEWA_019840 [Theileria equi strain WA]